jgi:hypothetical protein
MQSLDGPGTRDCVRTTETLPANPCGRPTTRGMDMRRKVLATLAVGALAFGSMGAGNPHDNGNGGPPGPFGPNNFGLCTAWEANENGRENSDGRAGDAPPFAELQRQAEEEFEDSDDPVADWCAANSEHPGNGNGRG